MFLHEAHLLHVRNAMCCGWCGCVKWKKELAQGARLKTNSCSTPGAPKWELWSDFGLGRSKNRNKRLSSIDISPKNTTG